MINRVSKRGAFALAGRPSSLALALCMVVVSSRGQKGSGGQWPSIEELHVKIHFDTTVRRIYKQTILSSSGLPLYLLDARIPSDLDPYEGYYFSGLFDCRLTTIQKDSGCDYGTLLQNVRNATHEWETDGRFLSSELSGLAGANSSRALLQRSRLRGMAITIEIGDVVKNSKTGYIQSFDVSFSFKNDPTAVSDIAATK